MRKFIHKVKERLEDIGGPDVQESGRVGAPAPGLGAPPDLGPFPTEQDWYRYRKQRGVNLGSWFVQERWISDSPFRNAAAPAQSDLDIATGSDAKEILEHHWDTWITDADWAWLAEKGINTVRIPIGYYHICGADPSVLDHTDFANLGPIFAGAWTRVLNAFVNAYRYGIGVLIDLHAAPGKQNADAHSGTSAPPTFFTHPANMAHALRVLASLATHLTSFTRSHDPPLPNLVGIELLNEPQPSSAPHGAHALKAWYRDAFRAIRQAAAAQGDHDLPLYIGDAWALDEYAAFIKEEAGRAGTHFVVLDHHLYRCFTGEDIATPAAEHARRLRERGEGTPQTFARVAGELEGAAGALVVGEWSAALNPGSLQGGVDERAAKRAFVEAQLGLFEEHCAGWFFWAYKKEHGGDTGWSFRDAVDAGVFPVDLFKRRDHVPRRDEVSDARRDQARDLALGQHASYWQQYPGNYEHWRFAEGFTRGWDDAYLFAALSQVRSSAFVEEIGFVGPWKNRRVREHVATKGDSNLWEFEHGFVQGLRAGTADCAAAL
ncbi:glycoside hydrolase [Trametes polyzona]|nr:glycoside hydrolase [Trametes polyzona]